MFCCPHGMLSYQTVGLGSSCDFRFYLSIRMVVVSPPNDTRRLPKTTNHRRSMDSSPSPDRNMKSSMNDRNVSYTSPTTTPSIPYKTKQSTLLFKRWYHCFVPCHARAMDSIHDMDELLNAYISTDLRISCVYVSKQDACILNFKRHVVLGRRNDASSTDRKDSCFGKASSLSTSTACPTFGFPDA